MSAALELLHLRVALGGAVILDRASASFEEGGIHAVVGRSGAGKSVLLKAACGLLPLAAGTVRVRTRAGEIVLRPDDEEAFHRARGPLVFVHQDPALLDDLTLEENAAFAVVRRPDVPPSEARARVERWLSSLGLSSERGKRPRELTPGVLRRAALARALCLAPEILVLDEPTTGLDPEAAESVDEALLELQRTTGATLVVITHSPRSLLRLRPSVTLVAGGTTRALGAFDEGMAARPERFTEILRGEEARP